MKNEKLFEVAEKLYLLEQARDQFGPAFAETVDALADDLTQNLEETMTRWRHTLKRAFAESSEGSVGCDAETPATLN